MKVQLWILVAIVHCLGSAFGLEAGVTWTSPKTGRTWSAYPFAGRASLLEMSAKCQAQGLALPNTNAAELDNDLFEFLTSSVKIDAPEFPHFTFRSVEVRFFPVTNQSRKAERFYSSQKMDSELASLFSTQIRFCTAVKNPQCAASSQRSLNLVEEKMKARERNYRQIGFHIVFVDALGHEDNLKVLEQEYTKYIVQKESYETARTLIVAHEEPRDWSGLLCINP